ncbi:helix-turn-helix domain-containing protein [Arthrobacter nitrophenolicus]|uniref:Helix-turn-helix domain-containing protein n=3 Tax=Arthrobacter nitrophenolicus TaxID=683150 RepID=A0A4R5XZK8_9MICC|nr:helix-turn-helix domain-containing protein [Arthrobacter nitrophenolicus]
MYLGSLLSIRQQRNREMSEQNFSNAKFLTVAEVAQVMRVSKMTVYRLVHSGEMPAVRFGRSYRVPENAVEQYLKGAVVEGHTETA